MFRLHESTRRRLCRAAFAALCLAPAAAICVWGAIERLPRQTAVAQRQLSERLGLHATLAGVEHPRPGVTRLLGLELADPETGEKIFRAKHVELSLPVVGGAAGAGQLVFVEPEIQRLAPLRRLVLEAIQRELGPRDVDWRISAASARIKTPTGHVSLVDLSGRFRSSEAVSWAEMEFHLPGAASAPRPPQSAPLRVTVVRNRKDAPLATGFQLFTRGAALPCDLLLSLLGADAQWSEVQAGATSAATPKYLASGGSWLGPKCRFQGPPRKSPEKGAEKDEKEEPDIVVIGDEQGWDATVRGSLVGVELRRLVGPQFPHTLAGRATLGIAWARFERGRLAEADCTIAAGPGTISRSLLLAASHELGMTGDQAASAADPVPYQQLAARLQLERGGGLTITGGCNESGGVLLGGASPPRTMLLVQPQRQPQPVAALVRLLAPAGESGQTSRSADALVPATPQAASLLRWLPLSEGEATRR